MISLSLIEDNANYLTFLKEFIQLEPQLELKHCYVSAEDFLANMEVCCEDTNILFLDLNLPGQDGLSVIPSIKNYKPDLNIIVLTGQNHYLKTLEAIQLGVSGYLLKDSPIDEIRRAITDVHEGGCVIDPKLSKLVLTTLTNSKQFEENPLSQREVQVLEYLALGKVKKEVAKELDLSYRAIALYTENIYKKLQVSNVAAAVATAIRKGFI
jgi:DNA-binding NarL/FixJ family response regulator